MKSTRRSFLTLALLILSAGLSSAQNPANVQALLTTADLQEYYSVPFKLASTREKGEPPNPHTTTLAFISTAASMQQATLSFTQTASSEEAHALADRNRNSKAFPGIKIEDVTGLGDYAFWYGKQLIVTKGSAMIILTASAVKPPGAEADTRAATLALGKKIVERVK